MVFVENVVLNAPYVEIAKQINQRNENFEHKIFIVAYSVEKEVRILSVQANFTNLEKVKRVDNETVQKALINSISSIEKITNLEDTV